MFYTLAAAAIVLVVLTAVYLVSRFHRFSVIKKLSLGNKVLSWLLSVIPFAALCLFALFNVTTMMIVMLYLAVSFVVCGVIAFIVRKVSGRRCSYDLTGCCAIVLTVICLGAGWYCAHHVFQTDYTVNTHKEIEKDVRVVEIADSHLGVTLDGAGFARQLERIQSLRPDMLVIVGDFVDDDSSFEDMKEACRALGCFNAPMGIYYVFGNHDRGYSNYRDFDTSALIKELKDNGVVILEDEYVPVGNSFYMVGRKDRSDRSRESADELLKGLDGDRYIIVLDHQPNDQRSEGAAGADLVLSGHTHGGHIFPAGQIGMLLHANDQLYGMRKEGDTTFIVTSGLSGWAIPFKTGTFSEFVVIDIIK